jgi:hypothetical protein
MTAFFLEAISAAVFLAVGLRDPYGVLFGIPIWVKIILVLSLFSTIMTSGSFLYAVLIWKSGKGSIWGRIYYSVVVLALISSSWQLYHWKLLGFNY